MHKFSVSSTVRSWIDHVARAGVTFRYTDKGFEGMLRYKKVLVFTPRGGTYSTEPAKAMDFHDTCLRSALGFISLTGTHFIRSEGLGMGDEAVNSAVANSRTAKDALIAA